MPGRSYGKLMAVGMPGNRKYFTSVPESSEFGGVSVEPVIGWYNASVHKHQCKTHSSANPAKNR
jgi:hypothetical protein